MSAPGTLAGDGPDIVSTAPVDRRWLQRQALILLAGAAVLLAVFENTRLDVVLELPFYSAALHDFPLRTNGFFTDVMHHGLKMASYALGVVALGLCVFAMRGRVAWLPRRNAALAAAGMLLIPVVIAALKHVTNRHCPWDVVEFGGFAPYVGLFAPNPEGITRGVCFPAGHASAGLTWLIWAIALRGVNPRAARIAFFGALAFGTVLGFSRMLQGAHFLSHTLWSLWWAWAVCVALAAAFRLPRAPGVAAGAEKAA